MPLEMTDPDGDVLSGSVWGSSGGGRFDGPRRDWPSTPWWRPSSVWGRTFLGLGALIVLGGLATRIPKGPSIIAAFTALGVAMTALAATQNLPLALILALAIGLANVTFVIPSQTLFQQRTPDEMLGRVVAIRLAVVNGVLAVAMVSSGALAQLVGFRPVIAICGILTAAAGLAGLLVRPIRRA